MDTNYPMLTASSQTAIPATGVRSESHAINLIHFVVLVLVLLLAGCSGKSKEALFSDGVKEFDKSNHAAAVVLFKSALEKDSNYQDARYQLAKAYFALGKYELAEKEFNKVALQNPSRSEIQIDLARVYIATNKPDQAMQIVGKLQANTADSLEIMGTALALKKRFDEAEGYLVKALKADPKRTQAMVELAVVYSELHRNADTRKMLTEAIAADPKDFRTHHILAELEILEGNQDKAIKIYRNIFAAKQSDSQALYKAGILYVEQTKFDEARKIAADLARIFPKRGDGYRLKGIINYYNKNYTDAIIDLQTSIKHTPTNEGYYFLGLCLFERDELENALSQFRVILNNNAGLIRARLFVGIILLKQKRIDDAIQEMKKLVEIAPRYALAHNILGSAYMAKGQYDEGLKELNRTIDIDPKIVDAYLKKGIFYLNKGKEREAETDLQTAVRIAPEILNTRMLLASYYLRQNNYEKAMTLLSQGLSGKKIDAALYNHMAAVRLIQKNQAEGLKYLQKAKEMDPDFFAAYFNLALYYTADSKHELALDEYRAVLKKDPNNVKAMMSMATLMELKGRESDALSYYKKALATKEEFAFISFANYYTKKKENGKALKVLDEALHSLPRSSTIMEMKGRILLGEKQYKDALKSFDDLESVVPERGLPFKIKTYMMMNEIQKAKDQAQRIITLKPNSSFGYLLMGSIYESQNDYAHAYEEIRKGVKADRENLQAILTLGNLQAKNKQVGAAMATYEDLLRINPDYAPALFAEGVLLEAVGKKKEAVRKYQFALTKAENYIPALNNLAYLYVDGYGNTQEGLRLAFSSFKEDWENPGIIDTLGYALLKNGRNTDALKILERAADLLPNNPTVTYHLALAYKELGSRDLAISTLQKSLALGDFPEMAHAKQLLQELRM